MKLTILSEDKTFLRRWNFFEFLNHEKIEYRIDEAERDTNYMLCFFYLTGGWKCENLQVLTKHLKQEHSIKNIIKTIPSKAIFCFHDLEKVDVYTKEQKEACEKLIEELKERKVLYCTHIFDLMQMLRVEKEGVE